MVIFVNFDINKLKKSEDSALLLGMFVGDGCMSIGHNGYGYRTYPIAFVNTNKEYVELFKGLFYKIFQVKGSFFLNRRKNKKDLWHFQKCSLGIYDLFNKEFEMPMGKKASVVRIPSFILNADIIIKKYFFLGYLITDGCIKKDGSLMFHCSSKNLLEDLKQLTKSVWGFERNIRKFIQRGKYISYQLTLNKTQGFVILSDLPTWHNLALRGP